MNARSFVSPPIPTPAPPLEGEGCFASGYAAEEWVPVCALDDIAPLGSRVIARAGGVNIALFRAADDTVFALADRCPHKGGPLSQGIVHGHRVTCPLHNWTLELATGEAVAPDQGCAGRYAVRVEDGRVLLEARAFAEVVPSPGAARHSLTLMTEREVLPSPASAGEGRG